ncbi:MAG: hypothetical protein AVDCRST_MAG56-4719 [uncultured Cytophagales bacterium]|uniref:DUF4249 domain-containing protein n=1 Tax=uncultured Cytophagales bacterium TaxID=158755 RepID=A0A6J4K060_9SPHI|nr:MAG: hypothetical protein AVDCRST_MAG56-4719 [uncultured Cytophagales bacterium]
MHKRMTILGAFVLFVLAACQRDLDVALPYEGDRLIIYGLLTADSVVSVRIDKTAPPTGTFLFADSVPDATAALFENGVFVENLQYAGREIYRSPSGFRPKAGSEYFLRVSAPGLPDAETEPQVVPAGVQMEQYVLGDTIANLFLGDARRLTFSFRDDEKEGEFYNAHIIGEYKGNFVALNTFVADRPLEASEDLCGFRSEENRYVLQDICFNGQSFSYDIGVATKGPIQGWAGTDKRPGQEVACDRILLRFKKITKAYRDYLYVGGREQGGFLSAFALPIREYTNVKGGYGLWAAYSEQVVDVLQ